MLWEYLRNSGGSSMNIISQFTINLPTRWGRTLSIHKTPRHKQSNVVYAVHCSQDCTDLYIGETKQPLHKRMAQHRRVNSSGQDSLLSTYIWSRKNHSFEHNNMNIWQMVWKRSKIIHLCQTGTTIFEQRRWFKTLFITHLQCNT